MQLFVVFFFKFSTFSRGSFHVHAHARISCPPRDDLQVCELDQETDGEELEDAAKDLSGYDTIPILFIGGHAVGTCDGELRVAVGQLSFCNIASSAREHQILRNRLWSSSSLRIYYRAKLPAG